jgi:hypothetical protein
LETLAKAWPGRKFVSQMMSTCTRETTLGHVVTLWKYKPLDQNDAPTTSIKGGECGRKAGRGEGDNECKSETKIPDLRNVT